MSYDTFGDTIDSSRPVELYRITQGGLTWEWTSSEEDRTVASLPYVAQVLRRGAIAQSPQDRGRRLKIEVPSTNDFARRFRRSTPAQRAFLTIQRVQLEDLSDPQTLYRGQVLSVSFPGNGKRAEITCAPLIAAAGRQVPRYTFMGSCNNVLFDDRCGVDDTDAAFRLVANVSGVSGAVITVPGASSYGPDWFVGGWVEVNGGDDSRAILAQSGDDLQLLIPFASSPLGQPAIVLAGCDHEIDGDCDTKFYTAEDPLSNVINYYGFAFVPKENLHETGLL